MSVVSPQVLSAVAILGLGFLSVIIRSAANIPSSYVGSDLALSATTLHVGLVYRKVELSQSLEIEIVVIVMMLCLWGAALLCAKRADDRTQGIMDLGWYPTGSILLGGLSVGLEFVFRAVS